MAANIFCKKCRNLLITIISKNTNEMEFVCHTCKEPHKANKYDSLRYMETRGDNFSINKKLIEHAHEDPVTPSIYSECPKCKEKIAKVITIGLSTPIMVNKCIKCLHLWMEGQKDLGKYKKHLDK